MCVTGEYNLMISNAQLEDDAEYQCQVGQATPTVPGIVSRKAVLTVLSKSHCTLLGQGQGRHDHGAKVRGIT